MALRGLLHSQFHQRKVNSRKPPHQTMNTFLGQGWEMPVGEGGVPPIGLEA